MRTNPVLYGRDQTPGIVAVEMRGGRQAEIFRREGGQLTCSLQPFHPFLWVEDPQLLKGWKPDLDIELRPLGGEASYRHQVLLPAWKDLQALVKHLSKATGFSPGSFEAPFFFLSDPVHQYLLQTGRTLFKGMTFNDLHRLQLDIETYCTPGFEFPNPQRETDRIIVISMTDSRGWECVLSGRDMSEEEMLREMVREITARDPDVIEGHNIFNFDLEYIAVRANRWGVPLKLGRDKSPLKSRPSRLQIAERSLTYSKAEVYGRQVVDTWLLAQMYDVSARSLESYGLKAVAGYLGVAAPNRTYLEPEEINECFEHDMDRLLAYALDDVRETRAVSEVLSQSFFYQTQVFPYSYQNTVVRGNATKIDALFLREYLAAGQSIPRPRPSRDFAGGYTDILYQGVASRVLHCDVQSLYPSILLTFKYFPQQDVLGIFPSLLEDLKAFRLEAKEQARRAESPQARRHYEALQSTFKILINSFYGYLGFGQGHFSDFDQAERVTGKGRELIKGMVDWLLAQGCRVIEIDTDGIYFSPPEELSDEQAEEMVERLSATLPAGIRLELAGRYRGMFSYKIKNYALLGEDGRIVIKGSGLKSRGLELFQRRFIQEAVRLLLEGRPEEVRGLADRYRDDLARHRWDKKMFVKTETLQESPAVYAEKVKGGKRNASAAYELALRSERRYQAGDQISYYVSGEGRRVKVYEACKLASQWDPENPDENVPYYQGKLEDLCKKFNPFTG